MTLSLTRKLIPTTNRNFPGTLLNASGDLYILVHETGNTQVGAGAAMHANFVYNGGGASSVSFHFTVDHLTSYQMLKASHVGWHASDGCDNRATDWGCFASVAIETCVDSGNIYKDQTRRNLAELIVMILSGDPRIDFGGVDPKRFSVTRIRTHNDSAYDKKWCPTYMLNEGYVPTLRANVATRLSGSAPAASIVANDWVKTTGELNVRSAPSLGGKLVGTLKSGTVAKIISDGTRYSAYADGYTWYNISIPAIGTGWAAGDWLEEIAPPAPAIVYADPKPVPELAALRKEDADTAAGLVMKNGVAFFTVWDEVQAIRPARIRQYAYADSKPIAADATVGQRRWVSHAFTADDGKGYYYDEHAGRLLMSDWKRVQD